MALSLAGRPSAADAARLVEAVLDRGFSFLDTADTYCLGPDDLHHNERLIARAMAAPRAGPILVATKGGTRRTTDGWQVDGTPERLYQRICESHDALGGRASIPLWQLHWPDPRHSIAAMMQPVHRAVEEGLVRFVGVCNVSVAQLRQACDVLPIVSVQNQYNLWHREAETEGMLEYCERHDLVFLPWRPLGGDGLSQRLNEIKPLAELASERGISPQRVMIAWHLSKAQCILPIVGFRRLDHAEDCLGALTDALDDTDRRRLDALSASDLPRRERPAAWEGMPPLA
jgi:aryl-alcohol dehydrogenase-like predicted oxidoreductase